MVVGLCEVFEWLRFFYAGVGSEGQEYQGYQGIVLCVGRHSTYCSAHVTVLQAGRIEGGGGGGSECVVAWTKRGGWNHRCSC